ncbi:MAG: hypothetical protein WD847_04065 [Pirellulales bacterium]
MSVEAPVVIFAPLKILLLIAAVGFLLLLLSGIRRPLLAAGLALLGLLMGLFLLAGLYLLRSTASHGPAQVHVESLGRIAERPSRLPGGIELEGEEIAIQQATEQSEGTAPAVQAEAEQQPRPAWVDSTETRDGDAFLMRIQVGPYSSVGECNEALGAALQDAAEVYVRRLYGVERPAPAPVRLSAADVHRLQVLNQEWIEHRYDPFGVPSTMHTLHGLLRFDLRVTQEIEELYAQQLRARRLGYTASGAGLLLGVLATFFGYLKLDTLSRGYYSRRLRFAAAAMILTQAVVAALMVRGLAGV